MTAPLVSVIVPMRNEARSIGACLDAIRAQDYPADRLEIVVVDGGSTDGSRAIVDTVAAVDARVRCVDNPGGRIPAGLNVGIRACRGELVARVDARCLLDPDYLSAGVRVLAETGADNVGGPVRAATEDGAARVLALATQSRFGLGGAAARYRDGGRREVDTVYLGFYPRRVLQRIGLYDEEMLRDQDDELNFRLRERGGRVVVDPAMRTRYLNSPSVGRFLRQNFLYGYWKVRVWQKHPRMMSVRHAVPPAFALAVLIAPVAAASSSHAARVVAAGALVYALAAGGAALQATRGAGWRERLALPAVFLGLHLAWGLGFLAGAVRFMPRWLAPRLASPTLQRKDAA
jgi:succinoglycan biosynthesis protein ExoA